MVYFPKTKWSWAFLAVTIIEALIVLGFEGYVFAEFQDNLNFENFPDVTPNDPKPVGKAQTRTIPTYLTLFIFGHVFEMFLVYDSLRLKNTIQVIGICLFNGALLIYSAIQIEQIHEALTLLHDKNIAVNNIWPQIHPFLIAVPCVLGLGSVIMGFICYKLYDEFAWTIYKHISADLRMKRRFLTYQIYITLLKFDFFFFVGFTVQFIVIVLDVKDIEFALTIAVIPVTILILLASAYFTRRESKVGTVAIIVLYLGALAYFLFKLVRMYQPSQRPKYITGRKSLTVFAVMTVLLIIVTIANACVCMSNFDKGLKKHIHKRKIESEEEKMQMGGAEMHTMGGYAAQQGGHQQGGTSRMTIE